MSMFSEWMKDLGAWLADIGEKLFDFITPLAKAMAKELGEAGIAIIAAQVLKVEQDYANGDTAMAKKDMALNRILPALQEAGIKASLNAINGAIENAVAGMRKE